MICLRVAQNNEEDGVRKGIVLSIGLTIGAWALLAGCGNQGSKTTAVPVDLKWKGLPYRLSLDNKAIKPNPAVITIPPIKYTANPEALETRAILVVRFTATAGPDQTQHLIVGTPLDIHGQDGTLPADYLDKAGKSLTDYLGARCIQGNVKISVALARSSVKPQADDADVDSKRLSDWLPFETVFKKPHPKC